MALLNPDVPMAGFSDAFNAERAEIAARPKRQRTPILVKAGRLAARALPRWETFRRAALSVGGFGLLTAAAWTISLGLGLAAAGVSLLVLEMLLGGDQ